MRLRKFWARPLLTARRTSWKYIWSDWFSSKDSIKIDFLSAQVCRSNNEWGRGDAVFQSLPNTQNLKSMLNFNNTIKLEKSQNNGGIALSTISFGLNKAWWLSHDLKWAILKCFILNFEMFLNKLSLAKMPSSVNWWLKWRENVVLSNENILVYMLVYQATRP